MNSVLADAVARGSGVLTRKRALAMVPRWVLEHAVGAGHLVRLFPRVYTDGALAFPRVYTNGGLAGDTGVHRRAAIAFTAGRAALSHTSALAVWGIVRDAGNVVHVTTPDDVRIRSPEGLVVHRRRGLILGPPDVVVRAGLPVMRLESALVDSWPLLAEESRRSTVIDAVGEGRTTPGRVREALDRVPRLRGRAEFTALLDRLAAGCRSPLEVWGHDHVFTGRGMPSFARQVPVTVDPRTVYLDIFASGERVDFELDGAAWHGSAEDRERDVRRDAALAAQGILVVRFTHRRLVAEPDEVRREVLAILAARRAGEGG